MNLPKLKGKLRECDKTYNEVAENIGISVTAFTQKINGSSKFYIDELEKLGNFLGMADEEKNDIFLH